MKHKKLNKHKIKSEMQFNMTLYYRQCSINETFGGHFFVVFFCRLIIVKQLTTLESLCYFCEKVGHFGFYPPKNPPIMNIQSKQILCG